MALLNEYILPLISEIKIKWLLKCLSFLRQISILSCVLRLNLIDFWFFFYFLIVGPKNPRDHYKNKEPDFDIYIFLQSLGPLMYTKTCLYTMPPDRHFIVDTCGKRVKGYDDVILCCGAGHCYKQVLLFLDHSLHVLWSDLRMLMVRFLLT